MKPYALIDLHCDTLTDCNYSHGFLDTLDDPKRVLSLTGIPQGVHWAQLYAIYIPDELRGQSAIDYFEANRENFLRQMDKFSDRVTPCRTCADMNAAWEANKIAAFLSIENGSAIAGDLNRVKTLADQGVRCITLTWNGENEIASGNVTDHGMSDLGRDIVAEMEHQGILVDVSHLNDASFNDLLRVAKKPFVASHSNMRSICSHKRNLTEEMVQEMVRRDCLIGLNYSVTFLRDDRSIQSLDDVYRHVERFLELGAEKILALGSDFDGTVLPDCLSTPTKAAQLYDYLLGHGLTTEQADGILFANARRFFAQHLV